jgi:iron complex outermembrane receptor protein
MNGFNHKAICMASSALLLSAAAPTWAETAAPIATAPAAANADPGASKVEEVTVFARKRAENVQTVPIPITVLASRELAQQNLQNFSDF